MDKLELDALNSKVTYRRFVKVLGEPKNGTFHAISRESCPECNGLGCLIVNGHFGTGEVLLSGYKPEFGELVKNDVSECEDCGFWQVS